MSIPPTDDLWALTEREKQTLRLIVRGHDAKSTARSLGLSVHTINERLRDARRKMAVSSSREAARLLLDAESASGGPTTPEFLGDGLFGADPAAPMADQGVGRVLRRPRILIGVLLMTVILGLAALIAAPHIGISPAAPNASQTPVAPTAPAQSEVVQTAQRWLESLDRGDWQASYRGTGTAFQKLNTLKVWSDVSDRVRKPLGALVSRTFLSQENLPAPPDGYEVVKFRTRFANSGDVIETVTFEREAGAWRVVGVTVG